GLADHGRLAAYAVAQLVVKQRPQPAAKLAAPGIVHELRQFLDQIDENLLYEVLGIVLGKPGLAGPADQKGRVNRDKAPPRFRAARREPCPPLAVSAADGPDPGGLPYGAGTGLRCQGRAPGVPQSDGHDARNRVRIDHGRSGPLHPEPALDREAWRLHLSA